MDISITKALKGEGFYSFYQVWEMNSFYMLGITGDCTVLKKDGEVVQEGKIIFSFDTTELEEQIAHQQVNVAQSGISGSRVVFRVENGEIILSAAEKTTQTE